MRELLWSHRFCGWTATVINRAKVATFCFKHILIEIGAIPEYYQNNKQLLKYRIPSTNKCMKEWINIGTFVCTRNRSIKQDITGVITTKAALHYERSLPVCFISLQPCLQKAVFLSCLWKIKQNILRYYY